MYEELIKRLREASKMSEALAVLLPNSDGSATAKLYNEAADAIENLQGKVKELHYLTCDVNKNEIMAQLESGNLENFLHAFRKYANKIADMPLPEPPKEE